LRTDRRQFLKGLGTVAAAAACAKAGPAGSPISSMPWGKVHPQNQFTLLDPGRTPAGVLELFLMGGLSPWETFYVVPEFGKPDTGGPYQETQWWAFDRDPRLSTSMFLKGCGFGDRPSFVPFGADSAGTTVNLGPYAYPLRDRPDILSRMRVWVMRHEVEPHPSGIAYGLTGQKVGSPRLAGTGAHVQRWVHENGLSASDAPAAYALFMSHANFAGNHGAAAAIGQHRSSARPLGIQLGRDMRLVEHIYRTKTAEHAGSMDALVDLYARRYEDRLKQRGERIRSPGFDDFAFAQSAMSRVGTLAQILDPSLFALSEIESCAYGNGSAPGATFLDETTPAIRLGTHLLTNAIAPARHVTIMDGGLFSDPAGQGYDSHAAHVDMQGTNAIHTFRELARNINEPGENDPRKLDLDKHFILLNTEFGRSPFREFTVRNPMGGGTNHWPWGYVVVGIGGFVDSERAKVVGAIGEDGYATESISPAELKAALLLAQGIWPFSPESFAVGDVRVTSSERDAAVWLREHVLGYST
jgi:hypothetical protein